MIHQPGFQRDWVYPMKIRGKFQRIRNWLGHGLIAILFVLPWLNIGGRPALLLDLSVRRLYAFGAIFTPRDTSLLVVLFLMGAFVLFLVTAIWGRVWCGYACPQTVFLESWVRPIEEWIEGSRSKRIRRDKTWTWDRAWRKAAKWSLFAALSTVLAGTLVSYLVPARELWTLQGGAAAYMGVAAVGGALFADLAWFREQFCNFLCPYARFQGALTDEASQVVSYKAQLGEPRRQKPRTPLAEGACIDCNKCVAVCPQGIDIRDGYQLSCINCARCVDACEGVMDKVGHEGGSLIEYVRLNEGAKATFKRPRTVIYAVALAFLAATFVFMIADRQSLDATVNRAPGALFTVAEDGTVRNTYLLVVTNNSDTPMLPEISVDGPVQLVLVPMQVPAGESRTMPLVLEGSPELGRTTDVMVEIHADEMEVLLPVTFKTGTQES